MGRITSRNDTGISLVETLLASLILTIGTMGMFGLVIGSIASNNRNKIDSTQTMLTQSILEQINSTFIGSGSSTLVDCAGNQWTISTALPAAGYAGAQLDGASIDFSETTPPENYFMRYVVSTPCTPSGSVQGVYDVRWHLEAIGTGSFLLTVSGKLSGHGEGNMYFALPVTLRVMEIGRASCRERVYVLV